MVEGLEEQEVEVDDDAVVFRGASSRVSSAEVRDVDRHLVALVLYRSEYNPYFKTNAKLFPTLEFLVQLLQHLPDARAHLVRLATEGRCSAPPKGWKPQHSQHCALHVGEVPGNTPDQTVSARQSRAAWARLLAKIYEVDALRCNRCDSPMKVLAVITDPHKCRRILLHLIKTGAAPPVLDASGLS